MIDHFLTENFLALEVIVKRPLRYLGGTDDLLDAVRGIAGLMQQSDTLLLAEVGARLPTPHPSDRSGSVSHASQDQPSGHGSLAPTS